MIKCQDPMFTLATVVMVRNSADFQEDFLCFPQLKGKWLATLTDGGVRERDGWPKFPQLKPNTFSSGNAPSSTAARSSTWGILAADWLSVSESLWPLKRSAALMEQGDVNMSKAERSIVGSFLSILLLSPLSTLGFLRTPTLVPPTLLAGRVTSAGKKTAPN